MHVGYQGSRGPPGIVQNRGEYGPCHLTDIPWPTVSRSLSLARLNDLLEGDLLERDRCHHVGGDELHVHAHAQVLSVDPTLFAKCVSNLALIRISFRSWQRSQT